VCGQTNKPWPPFFLALPLNHARTDEPTCRLIDIASRSPYQLSLSMSLRRRLCTPRLLPKEEVTVICLLESQPDLLGFPIYHSRHILVFLREKGKQHPRWAMQKNHRSFKVHKVFTVTDEHTCSMVHALFEILSHQLSRILSASPHKTTPPIYHGRHILILMNRR
jgi:hypothetical protein